jgi:hypothetical protein
MGTRLLTAAEVAELLGVQHFGERTLDRIEPVPFSWMVLCIRPHRSRRAGRTLSGGPTLLARASPHPGA